MLQYYITTLHGQAIPTERSASLHVGCADVNMLNTLYNVVRSVLCLLCAVCVVHGRPIFVHEWLHETVSTGGTK